MLKLQFTDNRQVSFWIVDDNFGIGSASKNQMVITDDQIQAFHATIQQKNSRLFLAPCDASAVVCINGHRISEATEIVLGDLIGLANVELRLIDPARQAHPSRQLSSATLVAKAPEVATWQLKAMTGPQAGKALSVDGTKLIGRDPNADIVISGGHVSRRHAEFLLRDGQLWVRDLGSSNGTYVNNKRVDELPLYLGDEVKFDAVIFRVIVGRGAPKGKEAAAPDLGLDKTQFRPALNIPPAPSRPSEAAKTPYAPTPIPSSMPTPTPPSRVEVPPIAPVQSSPAANNEPDAPKRNFSPLFFVLLLLMLAVIGFLALRG